MSIMTQRDMEALVADIEDGISMIVGKSHYYELVAENKQLKGALENIEDAPVGATEYDDCDCCIDMRHIATMAFKNRIKT